MKSQNLLIRTLVCALLFLAASPARGQSEWLRQFSTPEIDGASAVAADGTGVYVAGRTLGAFPDLSSAGNQDAFLRKLDLSGNVLWTRQFGSSRADSAFSVSVDRTGVYVGGSTQGAFPSQTSAGDEDAYVQKYDLNGNFLWIRQFGTSGGDSVNAVATDGTGVYVAGLAAGALPGEVYVGTGDAYVRKYDVDGNLLWTHQFGTPGFDSVFAIAADGGGISAVGLTEGTFPGQSSAGDRDAFVRRYDLNGNLLWTRVFGTSGSDIGTAAAADGTAVYVGGNTLSGSRDTFVRKYDLSGNLLWTRQFGTLAGEESTSGLAVDGTGLYVGGSAYLALQPGAAYLDGFVRKYDAAGNLLWVRLFTTTNADHGTAVAVNAGRVYLAGDTSSLGVADAFVRSIGAQPELKGLRFVPAVPCRVVDTRPGQGISGAFGPPSLVANESRTLPIPAGRCGIPASARAYSMNVTVVPSEPLGFLTLWPADAAKPLVSTLNSSHGGVVSNAAITSAGTGGAINAYVTNRTDLIIDVNGYFVDVAGPQAYSFYPVDPCRLVDTRSPVGVFGGPSLAANTGRSFPVPDGACRIPTWATAYWLNATVAPAATLGFLTLWPTAQAQPLVSTLNSFDGAVVANAAITQGGSGGAVSAFATNVTDLILDTNGYFGPAGYPGELQFYPVVPCRAADTRINLFGVPLRAGGTRDFAIGGTCGVPANAKAYALNVTVAPTGPLSYLTLWPYATSQPLVSTLNSLLGRVVANAALVPAGINGSVSVFVTNETHVIIDVNGYFQ